MTGTRIPLGYALRSSNLRGSVVERGLAGQDLRGAVVERGLVNFRTIKKVKKTKKVSQVLRRG